MKNAEIFDALERLANEALLDAAKDKTRFDEAINWGNLRCVEVEKFQRKDGYSGWRIYIEEAAPECVALKNLVKNYISGQGYGNLNIDVRTEW